MSQVAVETFECPEVASEPIEACEEAIRIAEELGLTGQLEMCRKREGDDRGTRCPYREMTDEELFTYKVLCPESVDASKYSASPIPLRVLQVFSHAKTIPQFKKFEIWDRVSMEIKDPVLVAFNGDRWSSSTKAFILARWGAELETFITLRQRAFDVMRKRVEQLSHASNADLMKQVTFSSFDSSATIAIQ